MAAGKDAWTFPDEETSCVNGREHHAILCEETGERITLRPGVEWDYDVMIGSVAKRLVSDANKWNAIAKASSGLRDEDKT